MSSNDPGYLTCKDIAADVSSLVDFDIVHFINAIKGGFVVKVRNSNSQEKSNLKFKEVSSLQGPKEANIVGLKANCTKQMDGKKGYMSSVTIKLEMPSPEGIHGLHLLDDIANRKPDKSMRGSSDESTDDCEIVSNALTLRELRSRSKAKRRKLVDSHAPMEDKIKRVPRYGKESDEPNSSSLAQLDLDEPLVNLKRRLPRKSSRQRYLKMVVLSSSSSSDSSVSIEENNQKASADNIPISHSSCLATDKETAGNRISAHCEGILNGHDIKLEIEDDICSINDPIPNVGTIVDCSTDLVPLAESAAVCVCNTSMVDIPDISEQKESKSVETDPVDAGNPSAPESNCVGFSLTKWSGESAKNAILKYQENPIDNIAWPVLKSSSPTEVPDSVTQSVELSILTTPDDYSLEAASQLLTQKSEPENCLSYTDTTESVPSCRSNAVEAGYQDRHGASLTFSDSAYNLFTGFKPIGLCGGTTDGISNSIFQDAETTFCQSVDSCAENAHYQNSVQKFNCYAVASIEVKPLKMAEVCEHNQSVHDDYGSFEPGLSTMSGHTTSLLPESNVAPVCHDESGSNSIIMAIDCQISSTDNEHADLLGYIPRMATKSANEKNISHLGNMCIEEKIQSNIFDASTGNGSPNMSEERAILSEDVNVCCDNVDETDVCRDSEMPFEPVSENSTEISTTKCRDKQLHILESHVCSDVPGSIDSSSQEQDESVNCCVAQDVELEQPPKKLLSKRKVLSPLSQEKLCKAMDAEKLCETIQLSGISVSDQCEPELIRSPVKMSKKAKNDISPPFNKITIKGPRACTKSSTHSDNSLLTSISQDAIKFSQRQIRDFETVTSKLVDGLKSMKSHMTEILTAETPSNSSLEQPDKMKMAAENVLALEAMVERYRNMMTRDLKRFCKIMRSRQCNVVAEVDVAPKKRKKIIFADEAGGLLCHVKVFDKHRESNVLCESLAEGHM